MDEFATEGSKFMRKIVITGRGGVGKSCFAAGLARFLGPVSPLLLIDADPDQNLAELVGVDLEQEGIKTISELLFDIKKERLDERYRSLSLAQKVDYLLNQHALYEADGFDLLAVGAKWTEGCYCQANYTLKTLLSRLEKGYSFVVVDSPAGVEHLNRRITSSIDDVFGIIGPSKKALDNVSRASRIMREIGIDYGNFYLVAGYDLPEGMRESLRRMDGFTYAGALARDPEVGRFTMEGLSFLDLPADSPFMRSVREIIRKAGYPAAASPPRS